MKRINITLFAIVTLCFTMLSCKKDDTTTTPPLSTNVQNLTGGSVKTWKMLNSKTIGGGNNPMDPCRLDNRYEFNSNKSYKFTNGTKCDSTEKPNFSGTWEYTNSDNYIAITGSNIFQQWDKIKLTADTLTIRYNLGEVKIEETLIPQ